jgi:hypothetical protein
MVAGDTVAGDTVDGATAVAVGAVPGLGSPPAPWLGLHLPPRTTEVGTDMAMATRTPMAVATAMMTTTVMVMPQRTAMRRFPTAMATRPEFTGTTWVTARMGIGRDMAAATAYPGSDMADIAAVSSGRDTAEECMEPTSGTVSPVVPEQVGHS